MSDRDKLAAALMDSVPDHGGELDEWWRKFADALLASDVLQDTLDEARRGALRNPYDEDGYCEFCGNHCGKAHSPTCAWADLRDARADAWDEGYEEGMQDHLLSNPYRPDRGA